MSYSGHEGIKGELNLIFINGLGSNYKGDNMYEFIFSDNITDIWDETWEAKPSNGYPKPPDMKYIRKVGTLRNTTIELELIQDSDFFSFMDSMDGVIALGWEKETEGIDFTMTKRLVFRFGDKESEVNDKLYERDIVLEKENIVIHEN